MSDYIGTREQVDDFIGSRFVEAAYKGSTKYFDAYTEITGSLPLTFNSRAEHALKDYRVYGTASGSGVKTENLFDKDAKDTANGYVYNQYLKSDGTLSNGSNYYVTEYIPVQSNEKYTVIGGGGYNATSICYYDTNYDYLSGVAYNGRNAVTTTAPDDAVYARFTVVPNRENIMMLTHGSTAPSTYIPFGYKIPILNTSGVTENLLEVIQENSFSYSSAYGNFTIENFKVYATGASLFGIWCKVKPNTTYVAKYSCTKSAAYPFRLREYTEISDTWSGDKFIKQTEVYTTTNSVTTSENTQYILFAIYVNAEQAPATFYDMMLVEGSTAPDHYIPHRYASNYDLFIGDSKLGATEYLDFSDQKIYKDVSGTLTPTDPPVPLPAINAYKGENTLSSTETVGDVSVKGRISPIYIYGWHVDPSISDPYNAVTYLGQAVGKTPAAMGSTTFSYGEWEDAFFMPKPCMLKSDGTVDYYLDPNDYTKKADGTASDIANSSYDGNAMMEWPLIWYKFEAGTAGGEGYFYCSNYQVDEDYKCWCNINSQNEITKHFYTAIYNATGTTKLRSLSNVQLTTANGSADVSGAMETNRALANNTTNAVEWYTEVWSDRVLISALMILISKNLNTQTSFGKGLVTGLQSAKESYVTGALNDKGLFWGDTSTETHAVKVFGMENFYGCVWRRVAGLIGTSNGFAYKLTYGTADGSRGSGYSNSPQNYLTVTGKPSEHGFVKTMQFGKHGFLPSTIGGTDSTYWAEWFSTANDGYGMAGGASYGGSYVGASYIALGYAYTSANDLISTSLSCKPTATS